MRTRTEQFNPGGVVLRVCTGGGPLVGPWSFCCENRVIRGQVACAFEWPPGDFVECTAVGPWWEKSWAPSPLAVRPSVPRSQGPKGSLHRREEGGAVSRGRRRFVKTRVLVLLLPSPARQRRSILLGRLRAARGAASSGRPKASGFAPLARGGKGRGVLADEARGGSVPLPVFSLSLSLSLSLLS